ncbi:S-adenosylmethionine-dependent methyltransferase Rv2258c-like [Saccoglossus kowalevskii]|uniref:Sterol 24-C-methyltransferase-like n=1 Tax=Saccoglossus kowalevskii TaxID=10224 RepID=A0ABM0M7Z5_SACKO|nr:PREDICTED: sterol 24-C-methyltransferase-like [Saccoglossus kowalevskii]
MSQLLPVVCHPYEELVRCFKKDGPGESGAKVIDIGCGRGTILNRLGLQFPLSEFHGVEFSSHAVKSAREGAKNMDAKNVVFYEYDAAQLPTDWSNSFDYAIAMNAIHDQAHPYVVLNEIYRILKPEGYFSMVDVLASSKLADEISNPVSPMFYGCSLMHCMTVSLHFKNGAGLGAMWGKQTAMKMLKSTGFACMFIDKDPLDPFSCHYFSEK